MTKRKFYKMHGIGNDYIYFDCFEEPISDPAGAAVKLSDRHFSVGGDGIVLILPSETADAKMRMFNADGSEGKMCGNAIRCVGKYLYERRGIRKRRIAVETLSGVKTLELQEEGGIVRSVTVDMGKAVLEPKKIPATFSEEVAVDVLVEACFRDFRITCVGMGNPHCVVFVSDPDKEDVAQVGSAFEHAFFFPEGVNTEFVQVLGKNSLKMRVWERGSGETLACGTGACAAAVAAVLHGYCEKDAAIEVHLRGGVLTIRYTDEGVFLTGPAEFAYEGEVLL